MPNKAFVLAERIEAATSNAPDSHLTVQILFRYFLEDANSVSITGAQVESSVFVEYSDGSHRLHDKIADKIRDLESDQTIIVIFFDSPGRF